MTGPVKTGLALLVAGLLVLQGCSWLRPGPQVAETLLDVKDCDRYAKTAALALYDRTGTGQSELLEQMRQVLTVRLQKALGGTRLVKRGDPDYPDYLEVLPSSGKGRPDNMALAQAARTDGFQALVMVSLEALVPLSEKKGMFFWRKDRFFLQACLRAEIFDPVTAAKPLSTDEEIRVRVGREEFEFYRDQDWRLSEAVCRAIVKGAGDLAKKIVKALDGLQWQVTVTAVAGDKAVLPAGGRAGVRPGHRMAVFGVYRVINGVEGEAFVVPGYRKGTVEVEKTEPDYCEVKKISGSVEVGDIAVPVR